jgi:hypothetical protein
MIEDCYTINFPLRSFRLCASLSNHPDLILLACGQKARSSQERCSVEKVESMIQAYFQFFWYLIRHKWYIFEASLALRVPLSQALVHDWTKLFPPELAAYAEFFYVFGTPAQVHIGPIRYIQGYRHRIMEARNHHQCTNPHHWQYWLVNDPKRGPYATAMPERFVREMVADWTAAGRAQRFPDTVAWYRKNKDEIMLHPTTRNLVEHVLEEARQKGLTWRE